jgi:hypothetical protein
MAKNTLSNRLFYYYNNNCYIFLVLKAGLWHGFGLGGDTNFLSKIMVLRAKLNKENHFSVLC